MVSLTLFVALVFMGREIPKISILADDTSNDGDVMAVVREPHAVPLVARDPGRKQWAQLVSTVPPTFFIFCLPLSISVPAYKKQGLNLLFILHFLRL